VKCSPEERARLGIPEGVIRYLTGIEDVEDLIDDLTSALEQFQLQRRFAIALWAWRSSELPP
jgi:hypothetical protein